MPWKIQPIGGKFKVVNIESGKVMGTHPTRAKASAQLRALYANVPEARRPAEKETPATFAEAMATPAHGAGGLFSVPGIGGAKPPMKKKVSKPEEEEPEDEEVAEKGGPGSGNFGHAGIPGHHGGSAPGKGGNYTPNPKRFVGGKANFSTGRVVDIPVELHGKGVGARIVGDDSSKVSVRVSVNNPVRKPKWKTLTFGEGEATITGAPQRVITRTVQNLGGGFGKLTQVEAETNGIPVSLKFKDSEGKDGQLDGFLVSRVSIDANTEEIAGSRNTRKLSVTISKGFGNGKGWIFIEKKTGYNISPNYGLSQSRYAVESSLEKLSSKTTEELQKSLESGVNTWGGEANKEWQNSAAGTGEITVFKEAKSGKYRWILFSSNAFQDRDGEIVSTKALADDVDRADLEGSYGPLRWWHVPGAELGDCDFNMLYGRTLIESGTFRDDRYAERVKELSSMLQVSIGFKHPADEPDGDGVYHHIRRFERSLLPKGIASNSLTGVIVKGE